MTHHHESHDDEEASIGRAIDRLLDTVEALGGHDEHRRDMLVEGAEERGLDRPVAEQAYDIAREEGLDPAYGLALVLDRLSVQPLASPRPEVETSEPNEPEWVDAPPEPRLAERERRLRQTFRRFRSHLESAGAPQSATEAFAREPDLELYDY